MEQFFAEGYASMNDAQLHLRKHVDEARRASTCDAMMIVAESGVAAAGADERYSAAGYGGLSRCESDGRGARGRPGVES